MATQTQTVKDLLQFFRDELKLAADTHGEVAKEHLRTAIEHAKATRAELETRLREQHAKDKSRLEATAAYLQEAARQANAAFDASGEQFKEYVKKSLVAAKAALEE